MTSTAVAEIHPTARLEDMKTFLARVSSPAAIEEQQQLAAAYDRVCASLIGENDVQVDGDRTFKKKSAWRKLGRHFSISTFVVSSKIDYVADPDVDSDRELILVATVVVRGVAVWGQSSEAIGVCATDEESGQRVITIADALATAETRATNRAVSNLIAMGEVSAEEIQRSDGSGRSNGPPQRKERPAEEIKIPFGPSKGTKLGEMESRDLEGALEWAEDKGKFDDFQKAAKIVIENRKKANATLLHPDDPRGKATDPAAVRPEDQPAALTLEEAKAYPFPFQQGKPVHGRPLDKFDNEGLQSIRGWLLSMRQDNPNFHTRTLGAIDLILADREKDQTKLDLSGEPKPEAEPAKADSLPAQSSQEAKTPAAAPSGQPHPPGKVADALPEGADPTSRAAYYARIRKALESPAITLETRQLYQDDNVNGFKGPGRHRLDWWAKKLEEIAAKDPNSFPSALEDSARPGKDGLPF